VITRILDGGRAFLAGIRALFHVLYHQPNGC